MARTVSRNIRTPRLTKLRYGKRTASAVAWPNITSSLEKPKTKASLRSISVTCTSSPSDSDSRVQSSNPPKPAPSTVIRAFIPLLLRFRALDLHFSADAQHGVHDHCRRVGLVALVRRGDH